MLPSEFKENESTRPSSTIFKSALVAKLRIKYLKFQLFELFI